MKINTIANIPIKVGGESINEVETLVYMGSVVDKQGAQRHHSKDWQGNSGFCYVEERLNIKTKNRIFNSNIKSILLYGCET
jgi:hypothetical protein